MLFYVSNLTTFDGCDSNQFERNDWFDRGHVGAAGVWREGGGQGRAGPLTLNWWRPVPMAPAAGSGPGPLLDELPGMRAALSLQVNDSAALHCPPLATPRCATTEQSVQGLDKRSNGNNSSDDDLGRSQGHLRAQPSHCFQWLRLKSPLQHCCVETTMNSVIKLGTKYIRRLFVTWLLQCRDTIITVFVCTIHWETFENQF